MAYISTNEVKEIRKSLKEKFGKNIKFSVTRDPYNGVRVSLMEGVIDFFDGSMDMTHKYSGRVQKFDGHAQINHYHAHFMVSMSNYSMTLKQFVILLLLKLKVVVLGTITLMQ